MIFPLLFGIGLLVWGGIEFRKYILFITGIKMKGNVTKAELRKHGIRWPMFLAEITYKYEINGKEYLNTEISDKHKHLVKTHSMKGETIGIMVRKKTPEISTLRSSKHYFKNFIYIFISGLFLTLIGMASW